MKNSQAIALAWFRALPVEAQNALCALYVPQMPIDFVKQSKVKIELIHLYEIELGQHQVVKGEVVDL